MRRLGGGYVIRRSSSYRVSAGRSSEHLHRACQVLIYSTRSCFSTNCSLCHDLPFRQSEHSASRDSYNCKYTDVTIVTCVSGFYEAEMSYLVSWVYKFHDEQSSPCFVVWYAAAILCGLLPQLHNELHNSIIADLFSTMSPCDLVGAYNRLRSAAEWPL